MTQKHKKLIVIVVVVGVLITAAAFAGKSYYEQEVTLDQVPAAAQATILKEAGDGTIKKIERELELGQIIYEATIVFDDKRIEIEVASDGTPQIEDEDDDDDDTDDDNDDDRH